MDTENSDPMLTVAEEQDQARKPSRWPWLVGGLAIGLVTGVAVARYLAAARDFFRMPGWGWAATEMLAQTIFRIGPRH